MSRNRSRVVDRFDMPTGTVIGAGFTIQAARLSGADNGSMRIDGNVIGNVEMNGVLSLGETGFVDGDVIADSARVAGRVLGNIQCKTALHLVNTAEVMGDILTGTLIVDDGAVFHGLCQTLDTPMVPTLTYAG